MKINIFFIALSSFLFAQQPTQYANETARPSEEWVKNGIIYEIYPRAFLMKEILRELNNVFLN